MILLTYLMTVSNDFACSQDLIEMAKEHEETGRMEQMHEQLFSAYCQLPAESPNSGSSHCGTGIWQRKLRAIAS